jgi:trigger factor
MKINITKLPKSEIEIGGELEAEIFEGYYKKAFKTLSENIEIPGFRKGKAPENILLSKIPEISILEEMAELALGEHYPKIVEENKIDVISRPEISIVKLARKNPLVFKIKTTVIPEVKLPDYKNLAKKVISDITEEDKKIEVTDEEIENTITDIRKTRAKKVHMKDMAEGHVHKEGEEHEHTEEPKEELPELNDEFVQALGPFKDVGDFREKLKENIKLEKENLFREKNRMKIVEKILEESLIDTPEILIDIELNKILYRMESDIGAMGLKFEDYLKHLNKTVDDLKKEFKGDAEKKAKLALILNKISEIEKIVADEAEIEKEVAHILEHYKDADKDRARIHAHNILTNEKIFQFLENQN